MARYVFIIFLRNSRKEIFIQNNQSLVIWFLWDTREQVQSCQFHEMEQMHKRGKQAWQIVWSSNARTGSDFGLNGNVIDLSCAIIYDEAIV